MVINQNKILKLFTGRAVLAAVLLVGTFMSCAKIEDSMQGGSGYISFQSISIDVSVNGEFQTKASVPEADLPSADDFVITISGNAIDEDIVLDHDEYQDGPILLPVGTYTVSATSGSNEFGTPYFHKSETVEIKEDQTETISWDNVSLANAMVKVTLPDMDRHLRDGVLTLSDGTGTINVNADEYHYVPVKENVPVAVSLSGTNTVGQPKTFTSSLAVEAKHAYNVVFDLSLPTDFAFADQSAGAIAGRLYLTSLASGTGLDQNMFKYMISSDGGLVWSEIEPVAKGRCWLISGLDDRTTYRIKAVYGGMETEPWEFTPSTPSPVTGFTVAHDYSANVLTGSTVTVSGTDVSYTEMLAGLITERGVKLVNSAGTVVRTLSGRETGKIDATADWPYLPQGTYTLQPFFEIGGEEVIYSTSSPATSPAPAFAVTAYAETSYSRYTSSDAAMKSKANDAGTGDKVMNIQGKVSISDQILGNSNYSGLINAALTYDGISMLTSPAVTSSTFLPNTLAGNEGLFDAANFDVIGQAWGLHKVAASFTFDNVPASSTPVDCHVTGIPYVKDFTTDSDFTNWEYSGYKEWSTDGFGFRLFYMYFGTKKITSAFSPEFYLPSVANITVTADMIAYSEGGNTKSESGHLGITTGKTVVRSYTLGLSEQTVFPTNPKRQKLSYSTSMTDKQRVSVSVTPGGWSSPAQRHHIYLPYFSIQYSL